MTARIVLDQAGLHQLLESPSGPIGKDLARRCAQVDRSAKSFCPVDTGRLRSSINWSIGSDSRGLVGVIGTNVTYAPYVELGTRYMVGRAFLRRALAAAT